MLSASAIKEIAIKQLANDAGCTPERFVYGQNRIIFVQNKNPGANNFFKLFAMPWGCVASSNHPAMLAWCQTNMQSMAHPWVLDATALFPLQNQLNQMGYAIRHIRQCFLPSANALANAPVPKCKMTQQWYGQQALLQFKGKTHFTEALAFNPLAPDIMATAALLGNHIVGMAGASADCEKMWQVGIDVLPEYCGQNIGKTLVYTLRNQLLGMGIVPFYGTSSSHITSQRLALGAGFAPAWAELEVAPLDETQ